jgi:hypothetical protein
MLIRCSPSLWPFGIFCGLRFCIPFKLSASCCRRRGLNSSETGWHRVYFFGEKVSCTCMCT